MESSHVPADAERIVAAEATKLAVELVTVVGLVDVPHVSLHVGLVHALVRAEATGERRAARVHLAAGLQVLLQQVLQGIDFLAEDAHVPLVLHSQAWLRRVLEPSNVVVVPGHVVTGHVPASSS